MEFKFWSLHKRFGALNKLYDFPLQLINFLKSRFVWKIEKGHYRILRGRKHKTSM